jgi:hypothetical protein
MQVPDAHLRLAVDLLSVSENSCADCGEGRRRVAKKTRDSQHVSEDVGGNLKRFPSGNMKAVPGFLCNFL